MLETLPLMLTDVVGVLEAVLVVLGVVDTVSVLVTELLEEAVLVMLRLDEAVPLPLWDGLPVGEPDGVELRVLPALLLPV